MIRFHLNGRAIEVDARPTDRLLDVLRDRLHLTAAKEGCGEGDCAACAVLVGRPHESGVRHRSVCSCLVPVSEVEGLAVTTVEGFVEPAHDVVREALRAEHAVQCGYCTPGLVIALEGFLLSAPAYTPEAACEAVSGQLCRCTGYASIRRACERLAAEAESLLPHPPPPDSGARIEALEAAAIVPQGLLVRAIPQPPSASSGELPVAGGTDLFAAPGAPRGETSLRSLAREPALHRICIEGDRVELGAATTFEAFARDPELCARIPALRRFESLVASPPIRGVATLGGNLVHASPIGDASVLLLALGAELFFSGDFPPLPIDRFFLGDRRVALPSGALLERIAFRLPAPDERIGYEKVGKRTHLDIASVCSASRIRIVDGVVVAARLSAGGVASRPLLLERTAEALIGRRLDAQLAREAMRVAESEVRPIDDLRGSATYKRRLLGRLVLAPLLDLDPSLASVLEVAS